MTNRNVKGVSLTRAQLRANFPELDKGSDAAIDSVTASTTLDEGHCTVLADATGGAIVLTLPTAASAYSDGLGRRYTAKKIDSGGNTVTLDGAGSETIDGATTKVLSAQYASVTIQSNGTAWFIVD